MFCENPACRFNVPSLEKRAGEIMKLPLDGFEDEQRSRRLYATRTTKEIRAYTFCSTCIAAINVVYKRSEKDPSERKGND